MATGDVQGSVERLRSELRHIRYPSELDCTGAKLGVPAAFLPVLNYVLLKFSRHVAHQLVSAGYELQGKTDARFVEAAFKIIRDKFGLRPVLTAAQFLEQGFAERKLMLVSDVIAYCKSFHNAAVRRARLAAASAPTKSGRDAAMNGKGGASQLSTGSRKSKAKSGLPRAPQQPRVQRHSAAASEADTASASAAAALQARLGPSSAQLAHVDQSQNIDPNPWGPPAHALGTRPLPSGHPPASHCYATVSGHTSHDRPSEQRSLPWQEHHQQQHSLECNSQQNMGQAKGNMPDAKQAWFVNPAFGSESPMPSPEKQPRRQGPPLPHPSSYPGGAGPQGYDKQRPGSQPGFSSVSDHAALRQVSPQQYSQDASRSMSYSHHPSHAQQQEARPTSLQAPSLAGGVPGHAHSSLHQQPPYRFPAVVTSHAQLEPNTSWPGWQAAQGHDADQVLKSGHTSPHQQHLHRRHVFPSMPARQQQHSQQAGSSDRLHEAPLQRPATAVRSQTSPTKLPQHAHHPPSSPHTGSQHQHDRMQEEYYHEQLQRQLPQQLQSQLAGQALGEQQHHQQLQEQEIGQHQQRDSGGSARGGVGGVDMAGYVQGLQQRLAAAEEQAAEARQEGERRAHTLEARITVLEGRVRFVEGELAAERERNAPATHCKPADSSSMHRTGVVAVCLSPAAAKSRQDQMAAGPAARQAVPMPAVETPHQCKGATVSPTRSTAGTPGHRPGKLGVSRQLGLSALSQQSPARSLRAAAAAAAPPSPASSMHSYRSTSELIESIQNRYLEAQSFLKSYKL